VYVTAQRVGRVSRAHLERACEVALDLFALGQAHAERQGLILVDTKYELGLIDGEVAIIDEVHTADSSRFWVRETWAARIAAGDVPEMLDKENLRRWLLSIGYCGEGTPPGLTDAVRSDLAAHYWDLTERVLGQPVSPVGVDGARLKSVVDRFLAGRR